MKPIFAMCVSASESQFGLSATAHLSVTEEGRASTVTLTFDTRHIEHEGLEAPAWLRAVLEELVTNFDDHVITSIDVDSNDSERKSLDA